MFSGQMQGKTSASSYLLYLVKMKNKSQQWDMLPDRRPKKRTRIVPLLMPRKQAEPNLLVCLNHSVSM